MSRLTACCGFGGGVRWDLQGEAAGDQGEGSQRPPRWLREVEAAALLAFSPPPVPSRCAGAAVRVAGFPVPGGAAGDLHARHGRVWLLLVSTVPA